MLINEWDIPSNKMHIMMGIKLVFGDSILYLVVFGN